MLINQNTLTKMNEFVKNLISSGEYSLYSPASKDKYYIQISANDYFELSLDGEIIKKVPTLELDTEPVYFENTSASMTNPAIQNFCRTMYY